MKTVFPWVCGMCLLGCVLVAGCFSETGHPDPVPSANQRVTRQKPALERGEEEPIREVTVADITKISPAGRSSEYHRVNRGETLTTIAVRYHTTAEQLAQANGLGNPDQLTVGQWLYLLKEDH